MAYSLATSYAGESFLSGFDFFDGQDLSHGFVSYQGRDAAQAKGLFSMDPDTEVVRLGVDHTNTYGLDEGRPSLRLESKESYDHGLFIADFFHMPPSQCGLWPAFWAYGSDWPSGGELDIIEGANTAHRNVISGHTADGCVQDAFTAEHSTGVQRNTECAIGDMNIGCGFDPPADDVSSYGDGFNAVNGGVYAMQWDSQHIQVWHFSRLDIPADITAKKPDPKSWGRPEAIFGGSSCDVDSYWKNMSLVININFCGDYGNGIWGQADSCTDYAPTCPEYVANNPEAFANAYWDVNYIDAYQFDPSKKPEPTTTTTLTSSTTTTVTVGGSQTVAPPAVTGNAVTKEKIGNYAYLGCFGSTSGFQTFEKMDDSKEMTLEDCMDLCNGVKFAGVFESQCFCADDLDANTRASNEICDHPCPGNSDETCGGLAGQRANNGTFQAPTAMRRSVARRAASSSWLLTVYGAVMKDVAPQPPAMATGLDVELKYVTTTVCPSGMATPAPTAGFHGNKTIPPPMASGAKGVSGEVSWGPMILMVALGIAMVL